MGYDIVRDLNFPWDIAPLVRSHHERWDGGGYPDGPELLDRFRGLIDERRRTFLPRPSPRAQATRSATRAVS